MPSSTTGKQHSGRVRGNGNNNQNRSGNPIYVNENVTTNGDHQISGDPYHTNFHPGRSGNHKPDCPCLGCHGGRLAHQSLLQPPPAHSSPRERGETQQQGVPISHTISNTTMSTVGNFDVMKSIFVIIVLVYNLMNLRIVYWLNIIFRLVEAKGHGRKIGRLEKKLMMQL